MSSGDMVSGRTVCVGFLAACIVADSVLSEDSYVIRRSSRCEYKSTACVKRGWPWKSSQVAVCLPYKLFYTTHYGWKFCKLKSADDHCKCDSGDKDDFRKTTLPDKCFLSSGDCSWYDDCLKAAFPCMEQQDEFNFLKTLCTALEKQQQDFKKSESQEIEKVHKCIQSHHFFQFTQPDKYGDDCDELSNILDRSIGLCLEISSKEIQTFEQRQYIYWIMKDLLEQTEHATTTKKVFVRVFEQPSKEIIPNVVFMITTSVMCVTNMNGYSHCDTRISDTVVDAWSNQIAKILKWDERKILKSCRLSFEKLEERRKRAISTVYYIPYKTRLECKTGRSQSNDYGDNYVLQREILKGVNKSLYDNSLTTLSSTTQITHAYVTFSGFTWCCYIQIGCIKTTAPIGFLFRNEKAKNPRSPTDIGASFTLYTKGTSPPDKHIIDVFTRDGGLGSCISSYKRVYFIIHGFTSDGKVDFEDDEDDWVRDMVEGILQREDCYVVAVDWEKGAAGLLNYHQAAINTVTVGTLTAHTISLLVAAGCTRLELVHIIGHSLGAQTAGFAGSSLNGKIGRITGLDPAGPFFETKDVNSRLDKGDALFVDVIHTDGRFEENPIYIPEGFGIFYPLGHVDFYPNGGEKQPGCEKWLSVPSTCSHGRSHQLFLESITSDCFTARRCPTSHDCLHGSNLKSETAMMGFRTNTNSSGYFYLTTNSEAPFCVNTGK